ncbi:hypothetical protein DSO57_1002343 [Entomophthora muscae]|uniref:Uncharacterized protein n=1 Tax=Entomophthora muscae TaxID=34485 RepID=A0ACC2UUD1_9FUNG|nr:hypothetical protein DSO57_1002343 [Entomophthora muscae]
MLLPRPSLESYSQIERNEYYAKVKHYNDPKGTQDKALLGGLLGILETQPLNLLAFPAWNGMFLLHAERLLNVVIPSWNWANPASIWMFKPLLEDCFRVLTSNSSATQCQHMTHPIYSQDLDPLTASESMDDFGYILVGHLQALSHHLTVEKALFDLYRNPLILNILAYNEKLFCSFLGQHPESVSVPGTDIVMAAWNVTVKQAIQKIQPRCRFQ